MNETQLQCVGCNSEYAPVEKYFCDECGGILEVKYDYGALKRKIIDDMNVLPSFNIWKYKHLLPVRDENSMVTLHEGGTPLIKSDHSGRNVYFKDESRNPSGAFKDRPIAVGISKAKELGHDSVVTASSGNAAASLAAYAAKANIGCYIFVPENTPSEKISQAVVNGARIIRVEGFYSNAYSVAWEAAEKLGWMNVATTFLNPYTVEGDKTIAYELYHQLGRRAPHWVLVPTGAGPLLFGIYKGFYELKAMGFVDDVPKMVAVQAEGCAPIVRAFESGTRVSAWDTPATIASAIADPLKGYEQDGERVLEVIRESRGTALSVSDEEIVESVCDLARSEGIFAEPAAAASFAGFKKLFQGELIDSSATAVCIITGHGLKDPASVLKEFEIPFIKPNVEEFIEIIVQHLR